ncbi:hypothetical protein L226DRAFT_555043 [Lentinus tigrinus ALCF2SS1-7]|uniref:L domain-like protein n=1 Tax=Lentinus tigrinus ALCF2SS1-6 TaxID=1328759 RepID=A0A5C2S6X2_9APHY|nr:hypothetical protein L227DRAFT_594207 [Lentinus tigrinus ALCF2SS1-6]RPD69845.1 hypothetical protein L226DRAFT_555043 [Lentinus tigrinus ALCF2SS1-7]
MHAYNDPDYLSSSPPSSPSLAPIDSSPPSSPSLTAICTPPGSPGPVHPFAGSTKSTRKPRIYEQHGSRKLTRRGLAHDDDDDDASAIQVLPQRGHGLPDATPTRPSRVVDPLSASAKNSWRPPTHEKKTDRVTPRQHVSLTPSSRVRPTPSSPTPRRWQSAMDSDDVDLMDDDLEEAKPTRPYAQRGGIDVWERAIANTFDKQNVVIELSRTVTSMEPPITCIPSHAIVDLQKFVALPSAPTPSSAPPSPSHSPTRTLVRATTMPESALASLPGKGAEVLRGTPTARAASMQTVVQQQSTSQFSRHEIELYLANNSITRLPAELFRVNALAVLSLRANGLTYLPPQIAQLASLRELNVAQNKLRWLPAEMLGMHLGKLAVAGNPWMPPPPTPLPEQTASDPVEHFSVTPLTELCLRNLIAPYASPLPKSSPDSHPHTLPHASSSTTPPYPLPPTYTHLETFLEARHDVPIPEDAPIQVPPNFTSILRVCVPAAMARPAAPEDRPDPKPKKARWEEDSNPERLRSAHTAHTGDDHDDIFAPCHRSSSSHPTEGEITGISVCPSPRHRADDGSWLDRRVPVFVHHAEERWTWQEEIAGVRVGPGGVGGVGVPVRWRGCSRGCLAFLDPPPPRVPSPQPPQEPQPHEDHVSAVDAGLNLDLDVGGDVDVEMEDLTFEGGLADPEDFEEAF